MTGKPVISKNTDYYFLLGCAEKKPRLCAVILKQLSVISISGKHQL
jgi:hypothetical protein